MAKRKRKTSGRSTASRRKNRTQDRMPAGLITLFAGLVLMALAFVPGSSAWRTMHDVLFGVFGCGSFVLGAALCYLAILYTRGEDLLPHIAKLALGLIFASGTVIVFSDIPTDQTAAQMTAACYQNGMSAWLSGGHRLFRHPHRPDRRADDRCLLSEWYERMALGRSSSFPTSPPTRPPRR